MESRELVSTRDSILGIVREKPGITKSEVRESLNLGWGTVDYHVESMLREGKIKDFKSNPRKHLFDIHVSGELLPVLALSRAPLARGILDRMLEGGTFNQAGLAQDLGSSRKILARHLQNLEAVGMLQKQGTHRPRFSLSGLGQKVLRKIHRE